MTTPLEDAKQAERPMQLRMSVEGMTCADCEAHVSDALLEAGAVEATANFRRGEARFVAPATIDPQDFVAAVAKTPYQPGRAAAAAGWPIQAKRRPRRILTTV